MESSTNIRVVSSYVHVRIRKLLRKHLSLQRLVDSEHCILMTDPIRIQEKIQAADEYAHQIQNHVQQLSNTTNNGVLTTVDQEKLLHYSSLGSSQSTKGRPHILGYERSNIYFSKVCPKLLAKAHNCAVSTIYAIKSNSLSALGISSRHFKSILQDLTDSNLMNWFTNVSGVPEFVLPPIESSHRSGKVCSLTALHMGLLRSILTINPDLYLDEIREALLFCDPNLDVSISTISRCLLKMGFSSRKSSKVISKSSHALRKAFVEQVQPIITDLNQLVFLDESTNARNSLTRVKSRSPAKISARGKRNIPSSRVSFIGAISIGGLVNFDLIEGTCNTEDFISFVKFHLLPEMNPYPQERSILILDNARTHHRSLVDYAFEEFQVLVIFLPPYSPDLNPIERYFASVKATFKRFVGVQPELRRFPYTLWMMAVSHCDTVVNYHNLIRNTYNYDETNHSVVIQYD